MIGQCGFNCYNQTSDGFCKTTVCINPLHKGTFSTINIPVGHQISPRYSVSLEELRQSIRNVCDKLYLDESTSNFMYTQLLALIQAEITSRCNLIK